MLDPDEEWEDELWERFEARRTGNNRRKTIEAIQGTVSVVRAGARQPDVSGEGDPS